MPPVKYKAPLPVRLKAPVGFIVPLENPDVHVGKSFVASAPHRITDVQIENARKTLRKYLGRNKEFMINIHATYGVTRRPEGVKMGQGKGTFRHFVARVPAGRTMFHIPLVNPFHPFQPQSPNVHAFKVLAGKMPMPCNFRAQNNAFPMDSLVRMTREKHKDEKRKMEEETRRKLMSQWDGNVH